MQEPEVMTWIRHGFSAFNELQEAKGKDPTYQLLKRKIDRNDVLYDPNGVETKRLAEMLLAKFPYEVPDDLIPLTPHGEWQAKMTGISLRALLQPPTIVFCAPSERHRMTLAALSRSWTDLTKVRTLYDRRLREQSHGDAERYGDHRIFLALNPEEAERKIEGDLGYRYPNGQSVLDKTKEIAAFLKTLRACHADEQVLIISSKLNIAIARMLIEHLTPEQYNQINVEAGARNCGVTVYQREVFEGRLRMHLLHYNKTYY